MRDFRSRKAWLSYHEQKKKGFPYSGTAYCQLNDGYRGGRMMDRPGAFAFCPYWTALELIHEGESLKTSVSAILEKCKDAYKKDLEYHKNFVIQPDTYKGYPLNWKIFRPYDEEFNDGGYGIETQVCTLPFRADEKDKKALKEMIYMPFVDPYCDGRDCTGARFTGWINIYTTQEKTMILHRIDMDI